MLMLLMIHAMVMFICIMMILIVNMISKKTYKDREKSSPFECGFDPKSMARMPFSLQFFLIAVIFLIFDIEIVLLFPMIISLNMSNMYQYLFIFSFFILILLIGLYHEWNQGALNWAI
uniref:NADH-ubiquinone oxidoreductase chain 3 n=1 Tax=Tenebrionoidea sp. 23 KM-2017 TaxID=2219479 RepID=A0A346RJ99_9CUCU|nr:NADH dehydrogenase subunit 3 [Tenebrionoidea sp. 23 KM-2017]